MNRKIGGYLRPVTASKYIGISVEEIEAMLESGELPGIKINGQWRVPLDQLESWLDEQVSDDDLKRLARHMDDVSDEDVERFVGDVAQQADPKDDA